jgi:endonuclease YncB( thermonuclease family)
MGCCYSLYIINKLKKKNKEIPLFDLKGKTFNAKIVDVYDGDTCNVVIYLNFKFCRFKVRALGYDSPEMKPPLSNKNRNKIINSAIKARNYFISKVTNINIELNKHYSKKELSELLDNNTKVIKIKCCGWDKYGRLLGEFICNKNNINQDMINNGYGYKYYGGTKNIVI